MANQEHLDALKQGGDAWNQWRQEHPGVSLELDEAKLCGIDLSGANLSRVSLRRIDLSGCDLTGVNFQYADLSKSRLSEVDLTGADLSHANLIGTNLILSHAALATFMGTKLHNAGLTGTTFVDIRDSSLHRETQLKMIRDAQDSFAKSGIAMYSETSVAGLYLEEGLRNVVQSNYGAQLTRADLSGTDLRHVNFTGVSLNGADMSHAMIGNTVFANTDLRETKGLDTVSHFAPSYIDIDTIYRSQGNIPGSFLRGAGVPDSMIEYMDSLTSKPIDYYKCFISYSSRDEAFAKRLYADLQSNGVRCWFAPEDLKIGDRIRPRIDESIRLYDKLLLVLSQYSVVSQWVEQEVETVLKKERKEGCISLFPIRLDKAVMDIEGGWPALIRNTRNIGDFTRWKRHDTYQKALERLLRDLKAET